MGSIEDTESRWSKYLHQVRGSVNDSHLSLDVEKLKEHRWKVNEVVKGAKAVN